MRRCRFMSARAVRGASLVVSFLISGVLTYSSHAQYDVQYVTSTGTRPEVQAMRVVDGQKGGLDGSWKIYVEVGDPDYDAIASIVKSGIKAATGYDLSVVSLASRTDADHQIVIGDVDSDSISAIAARYQRSTIDLGDEGYNLISLPNAVSGKWLVVIAANTAAGARHGAYTLLDLVEATPPDTVANVRIRDYPDSPHREVQHWLPSIPWDDAGAQDWLD